MRSSIDITIVARPGSHTVTTTIRRWPNSVAASRTAAEDSDEPSNAAMIGRSLGHGVTSSHACPSGSTIRISRLVLFRRRPPSSVATTMSSMRTPKRPGR